MHLVVSFSLFPTQALGPLPGLPFPTPSPSFNVQLRDLWALFLLVRVKPATC